MPDVFMTWAEDDQEAARQLAARLEARGFDVLWHPDDLPDDDDGAAIAGVIEAAGAVVAMWSPACAHSAWVANEARTALSAGKLVSVVLGGIDPADRGAEFEASPAIPVEDIRSIFAALILVGAEPRLRQPPPPSPSPQQTSYRPEPPPPAPPAGGRGRFAVFGGVSLAMAAGAGLMFLAMQPDSQPAVLPVAEKARKQSSETAPPPAPAPVAEDPAIKAFELAKAAGTLEAFDAFLAAHSKSSRALDARAARAELLHRLKADAAADFDESANNPGPESWRAFLARHQFLEPYVEQEWFRIARAALEAPPPVAPPAQAELTDSEAFAAAEKTGTIGSWDGFLSTHGASTYAGEAEKKRSEIYSRILTEAAAGLGAAEEAGTPDALQAYIDRYASLEPGMPELKRGLDKARALIDSVKPSGPGAAGAADCVAPDIAVASGSSVFKGDAKTTGKPSFAIDGNDSTSWTLKGGEEKIAFHFSDPLEGAVGVRIRNAGRAAASFEALVLAGEAGSDWQWNKTVTIGANQEVRWSGTRRIQSVALVTSGAGWAELSEVCVLRGTKTAGP